MVLKNADFGEFASKIKTENKKIVLFGAGTLFQAWIPYLLKEFGLTGSIAACLDNDGRKQGKSVTIHARSFTIMSLQGFLKEASCLKECVFLICSSYFAGMVKQLDEAESLNETECYIAPVMYITHKGVSERLAIDKSGGMKIPKVIHYCWFGHGGMPEKNRECIASWRKHCPDYEIVEWNEGNYDVYKNRYMGQAYKAGKFGYVPDYARIDILYHYGGIYLDTDVEIIKSFDELLYLHAFAGFEEYPLINMGGGSGCEKGFPLFKKILDFRENLEFYREDGSCNLTACGYYESIPLVDEGLELDGRLQNVRDLVVFPSDYFHPKSSVTGRTDVTENTYSIHQFDWSWVGNRQMEEKKRTHEDYEKILRRMQENDNHRE